MHDYTVRDFALDENFQNWVLHPDVKNKFFWDAWIRKNPEKSKSIQKAIALVLSVQFQTYILSNNAKEQLWESVCDKIDEEETEVLSKLNSSHPINFWHNKWKYMAAAVFMGLIVMSAV